MQHQLYPIFISYRHSDTADKAEHLLSLLKSSGYRGRVSFDRENLSGRFNLAILKRLDACKDFIIVLGPDTFKLLPLIPVTSAKLARRLHISVVFGKDVHSLLNMVSKSWVLVSLILMPKTA